MGGLKRSVPRHDVLAAVKAGLVGVRVRNMRGELYFRAWGVVGDDERALRWLAKSRGLREIQYQPGRVENPVVLSPLGRDYLEAWDEKHGPSNIEKTLRKLA
jgi:hypothetical protein